MSANSPRSIPSLLPWPGQILADANKALLAGGADTLVTNVHHQLARFHVEDTRAVMAMGKEFYPVVRLIAVRWGVERVAQFLAAFNAGQ